MAGSSQRWATLASTARGLDFQQEYLHALLYRGNPGANLKSISHRSYLFEVAFVWALSKETIQLPLGCLQGGAGLPQESPHARPTNPLPWHTLCWEEPLSWCSTSELCPTASWDFLRKLILISTLRHARLSWSTPCLDQSVLWDKPCASSRRKVSTSSFRTCSNHL